LCGKSDSYDHNKPENDLPIAQYQSSNTVPKSKTK